MSLLRQRRRLVLIVACLGLLGLLAVYDTPPLETMVAESPAASQPMLMRRAPVLPRSSGGVALQPSSQDNRRWVGGSNHGEKRGTNDVWLHKDQFVGTTAAAMDALRRHAGRWSLLPEDDDVTAACIVELPPTLQVACRIVKLRNERVHRDSWCTHLDRCVLWARGVYSSPINGTYLDAIQQQHVQRQLHDAGLSTTALDGLLMHTSAQDVAKEAVWLPQRVQVHALDVQVQERRLKAAQAHDEYGQRLALLGGASQRDPSSSDVDVSPLFPGHRNLAIDWRRQEVVVDGVSAPRMTALETTAYLYALQRRRAPPRAPADALLLDVLLFSGDSTLREMFLRLVHLLRHGDDVAVPFFDLPTWGDMVYVMYADTDALHVLDSPFSRKTPKRTVRQQLKALQGGDERKPLLVLVFLFSKRTKQDYRKEVWANESPQRLEATVRLLVEGTLFWETQREPAFLHMWTRAAAATSRGHDGYPFVALMGHPTYEPCRAGRCDLVPQRVMHRDSSRQPPPPTAAGQSVAQLLAEGVLNHTFGVVNMQKNVLLLHWLEHVHHQRVTTHDAHHASPFVWRSVSALDKAKMTMLPGGVLPTDHIHLACRLIAAGKLDVVQRTRSSSLQQWRTILSAGNRNGANNAAEAHDDGHGVDSMAAEMQFWASLLKQLDDEGVDTLKLPPETKPQRDAWGAVGGKRGSGRYVHVTVDGRGCADIGNRVLLEAMLRRLNNGG